MEPLKLKNKVRLVTAASLFDGHDASINIIRRILQQAGAEVIHLGHDRSVDDVVTCAIQEDVQGICVSSYQGGHNEYFRYMIDLLRERGAGHIKVFAGGGGVIIPEEKLALEAYGMTRVYHADDGRRLGLEGMICEIMEFCDFDVTEIDKSISTPVKLEATGALDSKKTRALARVLTFVENGAPEWVKALTVRKKSPLVLGITGTGGAGKSSLTDELLLRFLHCFSDLKIGVISVDPSKRKTGGALLGDRIRMNAIKPDRVFMRSQATRTSGREVSASLNEAIAVMQNAGFDLVICETSGIGQGNAAITEFVDLSLYVMTAEFGAPSQLEKIDMLDLADLIAINKFDRRGSLDARREVIKTWRRTRNKFDLPEAEVPVFGTIASQFNDGGVNELFKALVNLLAAKGLKKSADLESLVLGTRQVVVPPERQNYLAEIVSAIKGYHKQTHEMAEVASEWGSAESLFAKKLLSEASHRTVTELVHKHLDNDAQRELKTWDATLQKYSGSDFTYSVRGKDVKQRLTFESLSHLQVRKVVPPRLRDWGDRLEFLRKENLPGSFPFTAGVFPLKREGEDPRRQFAGEGGPERTNKRFHFLCRNDEAKRLSTAFDSVTLYGQDPDERPDIYGKVGESGVSVCTLEDMKKLYAGFDLCDPKTSVSMTINGPAPTILAFYLNTAIDQRIEAFEKSKGSKATPEERARIKAETLTLVRGTVQADILKEDQAQNTCIFTTEFSLKMMGDIQQYFTQKQVRNYYSVSISGYHIAEAGANPITQLAFTLANGFTYVEYYRSRGLNIDDFAPNLSFFFSNGLDPEYAVIGRVARRIWAVAMRDLYGAGPRSQMLKYHIQTSGRSLHAQEIDFNDIRTTLQALFAIYDNCNSLHTNAYDEAITTPSEDSVRRAMAIQMIINRELGTTKNENPLQGSYFISELTDLVEEAVLAEFSRIAERGGVLGAMELQYQRSRIQEESLYYETLKHSGKLPIIGVNTYLDPKLGGKQAGLGATTLQLARSTNAEKDAQIKSLRDFQRRHAGQAQAALAKLKACALKGDNVFEELMETARVCSMGQISHALFEVGGQYRRNL